MIDSLPLDLFGDDEPQSAAEPPATLACQWCGTQAPADAERCPACESRLFPAESPAAQRSLPATCQWCGAPIAPEDDTCPACGWDARGDSEIEMPGITVPFSETQLRSVYGGDEAAEQDVADAVGLAINIVNLFLGGG